MNLPALKAELATSPALKLVAVYRAPDPRFRNEEARKQYFSFISLALTQRRLYWQCRKTMAEAEERGDLAYYRNRKAEAHRLWRGALFHLHHARMRLEQ